MTMCARWNRTVSTSPSVRISKGKKPASELSRSPTRSRPACRALPLATKKQPGTVRPFESVRTASARYFSTRNSDTTESSCTCFSYRPAERLPLPRHDRRCALRGTVEHRHGMTQNRQEIRGGGLVRHSYVDNRQTLWSADLSMTFTFVSDYQVHSMPGSGAGIRVRR